MITVLRSATGMLLLTAVIGLPQSNGAELPATQPATTQATTQPANADDQVAEDMASWLDRLTALLAGVKDEASANAAAAKLEVARAEALVLQDRTQSFGAFDAERQQAFQTKYGKRLGKSMEASIAELERIRSEPTLNRVLAKHLDALAFFGRARAVRSE